MKFCEICGRMGAEKKEINTKYKKFRAYLCPRCEQGHGNFIFKKENRKEVIKEARNTLLILNGPISGALHKDSDDNIFLCHCDYCFRLYGSEVLYDLGEYIIIPEKLKPFKKLRNKTSICPLCFEKLMKEYVSELSIEMLTLNSSFNEFKSTEEGGEEKELNDLVKSLIKSRLVGCDINEYPYAEQGEGGLLVISIDYITTHDYKLSFLREMGQETRSDPFSRDINPLLIAHDDHGLYIHINNKVIDDEDVLFDFDYTLNFCRVLYKVHELGYNYVRFDTLGPKYHDFEIINKKLKEEFFDL